jgi:hypothetical protein
MSANANSSAIPILVPIGDGRGGWSYSTVGGLTKRELFAAMAMQGLMANCDKGTAKRAVAIADALLDELERPVDKNA